VILVLLPCLILLKTIPYWPNLNLIDNVNVYSGVAFLSDAIKGNTSLTKLNF